MRQKLRNIDHIAMLKLCVFRLYYKIKRILQNKGGQLFLAPVRKYSTTGNEGLFNDRVRTSLTGKNPIIWERMEPSPYDRPSYLGRMYGLKMFWKILKIATNRFG